MPAIVIRSLRVVASAIDIVDIFVIEFLGRFKTCKNSKVCGRRLGRPLFWSCLTQIQQGQRSLYWLKRRTTVEKICLDGANHENEHVKSSSEIGYWVAEKGTGAYQGSEPPLRILQTLQIVGTAGCILARMCSPAQASFSPQCVADAWDQSACWRNHFQLSFFYAAISSRRYFEYKWKSPFNLLAIFTKICTTLALQVQCLSESLQQRPVMASSFGIIVEDA